MRFFALLAITLPWVLPAGAHVSQVDLPALDDRVSSLSLEELEQRRETIQAELGNLARFAMNSGVGRIGYRSVTHAAADEEEWIEIDFGRTVSIASVCLVPAIWRDAEGGFMADAFPAAFDISVGVEGAAGEHLLARHETVEGILPRIAPFIIDGNGIRASWLRLTAQQLSPRKFDGLHVLQLSEILVFEGGINVARGKAIRTSSSVNYGSGAWREEYVVDGFLPYLMDSAHGPGSVAYISLGGGDGRPEFRMDLGAPCRLDSMVLHVVEQTDTVPQAFPGDFGVPYEFTVEGSLTEDFADPVMLLEFQRNSVFDVAPIMSMDLRPAECRFIRLTAVRPFVFSYISEDGTPISGSRFGFAELELYSNGRNVALGRRVHSLYEADTAVRREETLTDGSNLYGRILPVRDWLNQLALRHDLEVELPLVNRELQARYASQKRILLMMRILLAAFVLCVIIVTFVYRSRQQRLIFRTRERITADLHDVLGGNISAIGLLGQLAGRELNNPGELSGYLKRINNLAARTRKALKYITDMLNQPGLYENLPAEMQRIASGLTEGLDHDLRITGEDFISRIDQRKRVDIFLFFKECLVNIIRHSRATVVVTRLDINNSELVLSVTDNGIGLPGNESPVVPPSLRRRARILGGRVTAARADGGGTALRLAYKWNRTALERLLHLPFSLRA